jgi:hypothetical protein
MRAILIDPVAKTVTALDFEGDFRAIQKAIDVDCFTIIRPFPDNDDTLYLDDEGLFKDNQSFFLLDCYPQPLAGKGLILGTDGDDDTDCASTVEKVKARLTWVDTKCYGMVSDVSEIDHPLLGKTTLTRQTPLFDEIKVDRS